MTDFITMTCKSCGGKLQITPEIDDFACMYCGTEFKVKREGGIVALSPLVKEMKKVSVSTDKTASELAIVRLKEEIIEIENALKNYEITEWKGTEARKIQSAKQNYQAQIYGTAAVSLVIGLGLGILLTGFTNSWIIFLLASTVIGIVVFIILYKTNPYDILRRRKIKEVEREYSHQLEIRKKKKEELQAKKTEKVEEINRHRINVSN